MTGAENGRRQQGKTTEEKAAENGPQEAFEYRDALKASFGKCDREHDEDADEGADNADQHGLPDHLDRNR